MVGRRRNTGRTARADQKGDGKADGRRDTSKGTKGVKRRECPKGKGKGERRDRSTSKGRGKGKFGLGPEGPATGKDEGWCYHGKR